MEISAGHLVPAGNFCQSSRTSRKLLPANSYQPEDYASHLVPAGTVLYRQMPPRTTISYWYEMVEKMSTRIFGEHLANEFVHAKVCHERLTCDQLKCFSSKYVCYTRGLMEGCCCVEPDCCDGLDGIPFIYLGLLSIRCGISYCRGSCRPVALLRSSQDTSIRCIFSDNHRDSYYQFLNFTMEVVLCPGLYYEDDVTALAYIEEWMSKMNTSISSGRVWSSLHRINHRFQLLHDQPAFVPIAASEWVPGHPLPRQWSEKRDCVVVNHRMLYESVDCNSSFAIICAISINRKSQLNNLVLPHGDLQVRLVIDPKAYEQRIVTNKLEIERNETHLMLKCIMGPGNWNIHG
ncbi:hypothetical protein DAPPUDRAFT_95247 [Daphnia pulex]|uniref:Uncharacterized protein n=1 Tax=Daphnia pulex TaxID=6669 RepID=E9FV30_DAPPU|nr:hypothetical protein DAPPUDRAFT_95247 [Daphnia pulex]|eukprot:EFX88485.1 hypothetical protein DAPPUDRAFT_95247 [Daphnia pulex]